MAFRDLLLKLKFTKDGDGARRAIAELEQTAAAADAATKAVDDTGDAGDDAANEIRDGFDAAGDSVESLADSTDELGDEMSKAARASLAAAAAVRTLGAGRRGVVLLGRALRSVGRLTTAIGAAFTVTGLGLATFAVKGAGNIETLRTRLRDASESAEDFEAAWSTAVKVFSKSPLDLDPVVEAQIILKNFGSTGAGDLEAVANAAVSMKRPIEDVARIFGSLETEPLRALGIETKRAGEEFVFTFRDRMGEVRTVAAQTRDDAKRALIEIFDVKFAGGIQNLANKLEGLASTFRGNLKLAFAETGEGLLPVVKRVFADLDAEVNKLRESGAFKDLGVRLGEGLSSALDRFLAALAAIPRLFAGLKGLFEDDAQKAKDILAKGVGTIAAVFVDVLLEALLGSIDVFVAIARIVANAFGETFLALPGAGPLRRRAAKQVVGEASEADLNRLTGSIFGEHFTGEPVDVLRRNLRHSLDIKSLTPEQEAEIASNNDASQLVDAARDLTAAGPERFQNIIDLARGRFNQFSREVAGATGTDPRDVFADALDDVRDSRDKHRERFAAPSAAPPRRRRTLDDVEPVFFSADAPLEVGRAAESADDAARRVAADVGRAADSWESIAATIERLSQKAADTAEQVKNSERR